MLTRQRVLAVFLAMVVSWPAAAGGFGYGSASDCESVAQSKIDELKLDRGDIKSIVFARRTLGGGEAGIITVGYDAWVNFKSCKGALVIGMSRRCRLQEVYTRYQCKVAGVRGC